MHTKVQRLGVAGVMITGALALGAVPAHASPTKITLSIGDESSSVRAYSWGASNSGSPHSGGGAGAGKVNVQDFSVAKDTDAMTPSLIEAVATGKHLNQVAVQFTSGVFTSSYCLRDVLVSAVSQSANARESRPSENVTFNFARFTFKVGTSAFSYNIAENRTDDTNPC